MSLHARLAAALFALLLLTGVLNVVSTPVTTRLYLQEEIQRLNRDLASNIAALKHTQILDLRGEVRAEELDELFHWLRVVNPTLELYLLDLEGNVVAHDASHGELTRRRVALEPVRAFLHDRQLPVFGDDPRSRERQEIFSASLLPPAGTPRGYLYVVLAHAPLDSFADRIQTSYILRLSTRAAALYLLIALLFGLVLFSILTRPLRRLARRMQGFLRSEKRASSDGVSAIGEAPDDEEGTFTTGGDEVTILEQTFEELTRRTRRQLAEIERMGSLRTELIANISHDLRTPIASLQGYLETLTLKEGALSQAERDEYLHIALRQSERLGTLVAELFELTKLQTREVEPRMERFKIAELVQDNVQRFQLEADEKGVTLAADFDPGLPPVYADVGLMERALENLIENALCYTPAGGTVTVELRAAHDRLTVRVIDTGYGIESADLPHIFDRFYRARYDSSSSHQGAGLGLAITQRIAELHGSRLTVLSEPGKGSTFAFSLPIAPRTQQLSGVVATTSRPVTESP